jgi:penicillin-binding protein 1A
MKKLKLKKKDKTSSSPKRKFKLFKKRKELTKAEKKRRRRKIIKFLFNLSLVGLLLILTLAIIFSIYIVIKSPEFDPEKLYRAESTIIYDKDGNEIAKLGIEKRKKVTYDQLPEVLVDAIVATEDSRYFQHNGFDLPRFTKAAIGQVAGKLFGRGGNAGGGSTITMQVNKNNYTTSEVSITRKFTDIYMAIFKIEKNYSKEEIMEYYVNTSFLGNESYGVEQACETYFGKSVSDIGLAEASIIAGLFQAPSAYDPYRHPEETEKRRNTVLYLMKMHGYITQEEYDIVKAIPVKDIIMKTNPMVESNEYQSYIDIVIDEVENKTGKSPYTTAMKIYTNLDTRKQREIQDIMDGSTWEWKDDKVQAGIAVVDINNGKLIAVGGGRNRKGERQYNFASMINRQIGSTAKPLFDYGPAIEYNGYCANTQFFDGPYSYNGGGALKNFDNAFKGNMTLKQALGESRNIPAVKAFHSVENSKIKDFVTGLGIEPEIASDGSIHEAHALGAFNGSNPVTMAGAYAAFANGGYYTKPYSVSKVEYIDTGKTVSLKSKTEKAMSDSTAWIITDCLLWATQSYGNIGRLGDTRGIQLAAKTGTSNFTSSIRRQYGFPSNAVNDVWTVGYTPEYSVAIWYGYAELERGYYNTGGTQKNEIFKKVINIVTDDRGKRFKAPSSVMKVTFEKETNPGLSPGDNTPDDMKVTDYCPRTASVGGTSHRFDVLPPVTGLTASSTATNVTLKWNSVEIPEYYSDDNFRKLNELYYAKHVDEKLEERKNQLGAWGYEVIERNTETGEDTVLGFTGNNTFTATRKAYDATYIVKTTWQNDYITRNGGVSVEVEGTESGSQISFTNTFSYNPVRYSSSTNTFIDTTNTALPNIKNDVSVKDNKGNPVSNPSLSLSCSIPCNSDGSPKNVEAITSYTITYTLTYGGKTYKLPTARTVNLTN